MKTEEFKEVVLEQWRESKNMIRQPDSLDNVLHIVALEMGRTVDVGNYRKKNESRWLERIRHNIISPQDPNFDLEARYVIERHLLIESIGNLPITVEDLLEELEIPPGEQVGDLMLKALGHFILGINSKSGLLKELRKEIQ
ncbi:hypothetical protein PP175_02005 [Aneurinibacillus sp. Ricciae_BoGa-3]|uniref:hypothetical protein n=1 Tax=Aneurinibacillus sp. Ricciae_BoGa-3 TaxID=3022697 RepID=UPI002341D1A9|nr:hypothetical protein [Aneurinibacillus sp. Ricciae_BoGa-3]WCK54818.1 hypothetical protein PP175_02005 [Aneurinibacillus sp. Ricciae_BoGa-3]